MSYTKERWNAQTGGYDTVHYEMPKANQAPAPYHGAYQMGSGRERRELDSRQTMRYAGYAAMLNQNQMQQPAPTYNMNPGYGGGGS